MITKMLKNRQMYKGKELQFFCPAGQRINMSGIHPFVIYELIPVDEEQKEYKQVAIVAIVNDGSIFKTKFTRDIFISINSAKENVISYMGMNPLDHKFQTTEELLTIKVPNSMTNNKDMLKHIVAEELQDRFPAKETLAEADDFEIEGCDFDFDEVQSPYEVPETAWEKGTQAEAMRAKLEQQAAAKRKAYEIHIQKEAEKLAAENGAKDVNKDENKIENTVDKT